MSEFPPKNHNHQDEHPLNEFDRDGHAKNTFKLIAAGAVSTSFLLGILALEKYAAANNMTAEEVLGSIRDAVLDLMN